MPFNYRGRRVAYDNIAVGSIAGVERTIGQSTSDLSEVSDPSLYNIDGVSPYGAVKEGGGLSNIANAALPGIEDTDNATADKLTSDGETVAD